jgi:putative oxidoreductase
MLGAFGGHVPPTFSLLWFAGILELAGGVFVIFGLFTRPVAFLLAGEMAVAYFRAHAPRGPLPIQNMGEPAVLYCFLFLYMIFAGAGPISADRIVRRRE